MSKGIEEIIASCADEDKQVIEYKSGKVDYNYCPYQGYDCGHQKYDSPLTRCTYHERERNDDITRV